MKNGMHRWRRLGLFLALFPVLVGFAAAQRGEEPRVSAQLSTGVARLGERVMLSIAVENARDVRLSGVPEVQGLILDEASGPHRIQNTQILNGKVYESFQINWRILIRPSDEGEYAIPPIELLVDGQKMATKPVRLRVVRDLRGEDLGFLVIRASSAKVVEGQPFTLELRFGWNETVPVNFADLALPWWGAVPGLVEVERDGPPPGSSTTDRIGINGEYGVALFERAEPDAEEQGRVVFRLTRSFLASRAGAIEFPSSVLEFAKVRERGIFSTPEKTSYFVRAEPFSLEVVPLPREGQPLEYSGAVGELSVRANADVRDVQVGESIKVTVEWTGDGNLEFFEAPDPKRIDAFRGFRVFGSTEEKRFDLRRVVYDLAPVDEHVSEIPALPLSVFDPRTSCYTTVASEPIPIRVRPLERAVALEAEEKKEFAREIEDIDSRPLARTVPRRNGTSADHALLAGLAVAPLGWIALRTVVRRRRGDPAAPQERARRRARRALERSLARADGQREALDAFTRFLAARAKEPFEAWVGRDVEGWILRQRPELDPKKRDVVRRAASLVQRLERAVFGGGPAVPREEILMTAESLAEVL